MSEWIEWNGGEQPLDDYVLVEIRCKRALWPGYHRADSCDWSYDETREKDHIVAYRVVKEKEA